MWYKNGAIIAIFTSEKFHVISVCKGKKRRISKQIMTISYSTKIKINIGQGSSIIPKHTTLNPPLTSDSFGTCFYTFVFGTL